MQSTWELGHIGTWSSDGDISEMSPSWWGQGGTGRLWRDFEKAERFPRCCLISSLFTTLGRDCFQRRTAGGKYSKHWVVTWSEEGHCKRTKYTIPLLMFSGQPKHCFSFSVLVQEWCWSLRYVGYLSLLTFTINGRQLQNRKTKQKKNSRAQTWF